MLCIFSFHAVSTLAPLSNRFEIFIVEVLDVSLEEFKICEQKNSVPHFWMAFLPDMSKLWTYLALERYSSESIQENFFEVDAAYTSCFAYVSRCRSLIKHLPAISKLSTVSIIIDYGTRSKVCRSPHVVHNNTFATPLTLLRIYCQCYMIRIAQFTGRKLVLIIGS